MAEEVLGDFEPGEVSHDETPSSSKRSSASESVLESVELATIPREETMTLSDGTNEVLASPAARKMASEHNIDISRIKGTGKGGRITKEMY